MVDGHEDVMLKIEADAEEEQGPGGSAAFYHDEAGTNSYGAQHGPFFPMTPRSSLQSPLDPNPYNFEDIMGVTNGLENESLFHNESPNSGVDNPLLLEWNSFCFRKSGYDGIFNTYHM